MAPTLKSKSGLRARDNHLSPGAIAGTVVGCVIGGSLLLIVLGFLYFWWRRKSKEARAAELLPTTTKSKGSHHRTLFSIPGFLPRHTPATHADSPPSAKDDSDRAVPVFGDDSEFHQQQPIYGNDLMGNHETYYASHNFGQPPLPPGIDFNLPPQPTAFPSNIDTSPGHQAANSSYYDTRISMDSDPEQAPLPPSRQMTELYEAQLRDSREHRRRSGSLTSRIWSSIKRKRSTHSSAHGNVSPQNSTSQYFPASPVESPIGLKPESKLESKKGVSSSEFATNKYFEEPGEISESMGALGGSASGNRVGNDQQQHKRQKRVDSQEDDFLLRTSSVVRDTTEKDPELPSAVLRSQESSDGLPHLAQPQSETWPQARLVSPDIPEPMELDETLEGIHRRPSVLKGSHSPPLQPPESFVSPMSIMQPSNSLEKAAYTDFQMENSASPPTFPTSPPEIITDQPAQESADTTAQEYPDDFDADSFLDIPSDDEPRRSGDSYDYTTTPGQSSTDPSMGRTPDTRVTISPSPYPAVHQQVKMEPESSLSPETSKLSPQSPGHICEECGRYFDQVHKLNHHKRYHDRKHECPYDGCDKKFGTKTHLDRHINDKHVKSKAYHCIESTCPYFRGGKAFPRKDNWRRHMVKKHGATPSDLEMMDESMG
ncbi:uncharacterized protein GGS25DRAFT_503134 [Hypoxylon fragiforme]|uniref:uncharacterized protein n=1 Tax=Hypoxylon fragiforme TaxID=63214 RepID=UPI0020C62262|nr:uncharacterized protein GGS25DRAFT_503134 [Hypoxylon fragiforme]KAI2605022.1 hypothetical protein GGS25DRAFT_503134 [Hypoxylon fragiforme]